MPGLQSDPQWMISTEADPAAMTPVMRQVLDAKRSHPEAIVFFRLGDFYELFFEDALEAAPALDMVLTSRNKKDPRPIPMCGFPHHAMSGYVQRLVEQGRPVAIVEQLEDPKKVKGIVKRGVTRVITPGVVLETEALDGRRANHLVALAKGSKGEILVAAAEVSTGNLIRTRVRHQSALANLMVQLEPRELLVPPGLTAFLEGVVGAKDALWTLRQVAPEVKKQARGSKDGLAVAFLREYLAEVRPSALGLLGQAKQLEGSAHLSLNRESVTHLELTHTVRHGRRKGALLHAVDRCQTAAGARTLRSLLLAPLADHQQLRARHEAVAALLESAETRDQLRSILATTGDLARAAGRAAAALITPIEIAMVRDPLAPLPSARTSLAKISSHSCQLQQLSEQLNEGNDIFVALKEILADEPKNQLGEGRVIRLTHNARLKELSELCTDSSAWVESFQQQLRDQLNLPTLKIKHNRVTGWGIEVSRTKSHLMPDHYRRVHTLKHVERYTTAELQDFERKLVTAQEELSALEHALYGDLVTHLATHSACLRRIAATLAELDVHCGFAALAVEQSYCRPTMTEDEHLSRVEVVGSRHPVVEQSVDHFVANDLVLGGPDHRIMLLTGPNMAGKSTLMRQVALSSILAQAGGFVPATRAKLPVLRSILTRIGASDDISQGASTFMVEMRETAQILQSANERSLVLLDEIGRGTSTLDGLAIAQAVIEDLHDRAGALCLFATHYHELTGLERGLKGLKNAHVAVKEHGDDVIFVHQLQPGPTSRSHGITVAQLAGLPRKVIARARGLLNASIDQGQSPKSQTEPHPKTERRQLHFFAESAPKSSATLEKLRQLDPDELTPRQAHQLLYALQKSAIGELDAE